MAVARRLAEACVTHGPSILREHWRRLGAAYAILGISLLVTGGAFVLVRQSVWAHDQGRFVEMVQRTTETWKLHTEFFLHYVRAIAGLFASSEEVTSAELERFLRTSGVYSDHTGVMGVGYALRVPAAEQKAHIETMRRKWFPGYSIIGQSLDLAAAFPIVFFDALGGQPITPLGWNPASEPRRWTAMRAARDTGEAVSTGRLQLFVHPPTNGPQGFLIYVPVYRPGVPLRTAEERRAALAAFVFGSFLPPQMWDKVIADADQPALRMRIFDGANPDPASLLYDTDPTAAPPGRAKPRREGSMTMNGLGRTWHLAFGTKPAFEQGWNTALPWVTLGGGLAVSSLLFGIGGVQARARLRAERMTRELQQSETLYQSLVQSLPQCVFRKDTEGRLTFVNDHMCDFLGQPREAVLGKTEADLCPPERAAEFHQEDLEVVRTGQVFEAVKERVLSSGETQHWHVIKTPIRDLQRDVVGAQGILWNVTERRRAEVELAHEKERLAVTLRSISDGVITTDVAGRVLLANKAAEDLTGWRQADALGKPLAEVFQVLDAKTRLPCPPVAETVLSTGSVIEELQGVVLLDRQGQARLVAESGAPMRDAQGRVLGVVLVFRDITEKQRLELEMLKNSKLESLGLLAGGIAHDFNNILTAIVGNLSLAKMAAAPGTEIYDALEEVEAAALRAKDLTAQLLTFAKGGTPVKRVISVAKIIKEAADFSLRGSTVRCHLRVAADLWAVEADAGQLNQVVNNLVINAAQAMPEGGTVRLEAENLEATERSTPALAPGPWVRISVVDEGTGIRPEHLARIFDPYFTTKQRGSGLGLTSAYSIVKHHGGLITVESTLGKGSVFHVFLPALRQAGPAPEAAAVLPPLPPGRILVMDDELPVRKVVRSMLQKLGCEVEEAADGAAAIEAYLEARQAGRPFDAVILDLTIPGGMGGKEAMARLRAVDGSVRALVSSGYSTDAVMASYQDYGFAAVIEKPYRADQLASALRQVLTKA